MRSSKLKIVDLAIVGGGAAGMYAAASAVRKNVSSILFERKARLGAKVLMTANGRCNFTKDIPPERFLQDIMCGGFNKAASKFVETALRSLPPQKIISFFKNLGLRFKRMNDGRMFPADGKAATVVHAFGDLFRDKSVPIVANCPVTGVSLFDNGLFNVETANFSVLAKNVLLATGGVSYPKTGSVGDGQKFAERFGHTIIPYRPGLIGVESRAPDVFRRKGRRYENGISRVFDSRGKMLYSVRGEVDCEIFGLSGAAVYNAERFIEYARREGGISDITLEVEFDSIKIVCENPVPRPVKESIVTIGGVNIDEIDSRTMQSKLVPGLYFAGEVMDIDGPTGGYNLTLAFSTADLAVSNVARGLRPNFKNKR
jgi:predicted Rossmann fold flavoprotein